MSLTPDYNSIHPQRFSKKSLILLACLTLAILSIGFEESFYAHAEVYRICSVCGTEYHDSTWFGIFGSHSEKPTTLTPILLKHVVSTPHSHTGVFLNEKKSTLLGFGYHGCASGWLIAPCRDPYAAGLLDNLYTHDYRAQADLWRSRLMDQATARQTYKVIDECRDIPTELLPKAAFDAWWSAHGSEIELAFAQATAVTAPRP